MSRNAPPQRNGCSHPNNIPFHCSANHSFRSIFENLVAPNSPNSPNSRQIRPLRLVQSEIIFYLPIIWWEIHTSTMPTIATIATLEETCLLRSSRFNTAGLNAYWKLAMRKIVNAKDDIFVNVPFVNLSKICLVFSCLNYKGT